MRNAITQHHIINFLPPSFVPIPFQRSPCSAFSVGSPVFVAERRHACSTTPAVIDRHVLPMWRSAANPLAAVAAVNQRDRWTDRRTHDSYTDPALHTGSVINLILYSRIVILT